ncbi:Uncharacterised protein [Candidatus Burarchaeum australiense]|nr:Uncharacterised protein [Candidatus Burarchaeum australiense]
MTALLSILAVVLSVLSTIFLWLAIYIFRDIVLMAEKFEKKNLGSSGILIALPLLLVTPLVGSYYIATTGDFPPPQIFFIAFFLLLVGSILLLRPIAGLVRIFGRRGFPKFLIVGFILTYGLANLAFIVRLPLLEAVNQLLLASAEIILGICFLLLSGYTANFKEVSVKIYNKTFSTHYELSSLFLIAGSIVPVDSVLLTMIMRESIINTPADAMMDASALRFLAKFLLTVCGMMGLLGMLVFRKAVEDFCFRFGSMSALIRKEK